MLSYRRRTPAASYSIRGSVTVAGKTKVVKEFATGIHSEQAVRTFIAKLEAEITTDLIVGREGRTRNITFSQIGEIYISRAADLHPNDIWRIGELNAVMGDYALDDIQAGWAEFMRARCKGLAPSTVDRFRAILMAALHHGSEPLGYDAPKIKPIKFSNRRVRYLTEEHADKLIAAYSPHVQPIALTLRFTGCRTQEALQLQMINLDWNRSTIYFERTKNTEPRTVKMHDRVAEAIDRMLHRRNYPDLGHVFLNARGAPYSDTRDYKMPGGNPLRKAHSTAFKRANIRPNGGPDFTPHDWRHHFACVAVMSGIDLDTIKKMGGGKSLRALERYTAISDEHMAAAVAKMR